jgi:CheY-like chemotaxis protein
MSNQEKKALVVDDDMLVCKIVEKLLKKRGIITITAHSGSEANLIIEREGNNLVLVIVDLVLPNGITGWDIIDSLRNNLQMAKTPIIVLTGAEISIEEAAKLGKKINAIVQKKSFDIIDFGEVLERILGGNN